MDNKGEGLDLITLTSQFINSTNRHVFLTGKAGTGKTTFLRSLAEKTHKNFVIVAPTGIAALNAQGVTIHSQFLFPFGSFVPDKSPDGSFGQDTRFFTQHTLARKHPLNSIRKQVLRAADLLIIDEVSMLRADLLDAIDYRMRSVKSNFNRSFGGVQVLFIGDLYQLPPIVNQNEWVVLKKYYKSMHFFEAHALKYEPPTYLELDKVFRQEDDNFIKILNNLRNNCVTQENIDALNQHIKSDQEIDQEKGVITLTTHNNKANQINQKKLDNLKESRFVYEAKVSRDFSEHSYPVPKDLVLKVGAQVMFIRNDTSDEKLFFNGKIAHISKLKKNEVWTIFDGESEERQIQTEEWQSKKYTINPNTKELEEEVVGTFTHYPIKLAWAVTVHKSQGLTFEKAIIDVGQAFAAGQVYVALSRLRSLSGLILKSKINTSSLITDNEVVSFVNGQQRPEQLAQVLENEQKLYLERVLLHSFDLEPIMRAINYQFKKNASTLEFELEHMRMALPAIRSHFEAKKEISEKFKAQLSKILKSGDQKQLMSRLEKGSVYFLDFLNDIQRILITHLAEVEQLSKTKSYSKSLEELDQLIMMSIHAIEKSAMLAHCVYTKQRIPRESPYGKKQVDKRKGLLEAARYKAEQNEDLQKTKTGKRKKKLTSLDSETAKKPQKGETFKITFEMVKEGLSINEISKKRGLVKGTIESHIARGVELKLLDLGDFMDKDSIDILSLAIKKSKNGSQGIFQAFKGKYSYGQIKMVTSSLKK